MTIKELYNKNISLQIVSNRIVDAVYVQNYDRALRDFSWLTSQFSQYIKELSEIAQEIYGSTQDELFLGKIAGVGEFLEGVMSAQSVGDYILMADLIDMQLVPFLLGIQEDIRNSCDTCFFQDNWDFNIKLLRKQDEELAVLVETEMEKWLKDEQPIYQIEPTNSGLFTLSGEDVKGRYYFHSNVNPRLEAEAFANRYYTVTEDKYAVLGFGLGYHCFMLAAKDESVRVNIYESSLSVIIQAMLANELAWLWNNDRIRLIYDKDYTKLSKELAKGESAFVIHYPSMRHVKNEAVKEKLNQFFIRDSGIKNTRLLMDSNFKENIKHYTGFVDEIEDKFKGKRVVIVAAGPSLDKNVKLLLKKPDDVIIVAVETVFRKLLGLGIKVDYVVVSDATSRICGHMAGLWNSQVPLLYLSTAYRAFARDYSGDCYMILQKDYDRSEEMASQLNVNTYNTGGSVATVALDVCIQLGCKSIAFVGLDLAYTDNLAHAEGTARRVANDIEDAKKVDGYAYYYAEDGKYKVKKTTVPTSNLFDMYRNWMEKRIVQDDVNTLVYDATEGGSIVKGMEIISLKNWLEGKV